MSLLLELVEPPLTAGLPLFLVQLMVIIAVVRILGFLLSYVKEPAVIGEIVAGVVLGPSILGYIPGWSTNVFPTSSIANIQMFANIGLILFLFFLGMEIEPSHLKRLWKPGAVIAVSSIIVPFAVGSSLAVSLWTLEQEPKDYTSFILFIGTSFSFTAFPVLARILTANDLIAAQLGVQTLAAAALDDVLAWCSLAICLSYANGGSFVLGLATAGIATGFVLFELLVIRKVISYVYKYLMKRGRESDPNFVAAVFVLLFLSAWFAEIIGIHAFFGAFVFGLTIPRKGRFIADVSIRIELLVIHIFLPLYFAASGLRTSLGSLSSGELWGWCVLVSILGCLAKTVPVAIATRFFYKEWRFCWSLGFLMNTRGLVALIALNIGLDRGILGVKIFTIMVIMALFNTFLAPPILYFLYLRNPFHPTATALLPKKGLLKVAPGQIQAVEMVDVGHGHGGKEEAHSVVVDQPAEQPVAINGAQAGPASPSDGVGVHPQMNGHASGPMYPVSAVSPQSSHAFVYAAPPQNEVVDRRQMRGASPVNVMSAPANASGTNSVSSTPQPSPNVMHRKDPSTTYQNPNLPIENPADAALALALQRADEEHHGRSRSVSRSVTFDMTRPGYHLPLQLAQGADLATEPPEPTDDEKQESYYHALHGPQLQVARLNFVEGDPEELPEDMQLPSNSPTDTPLNQGGGNVHVPSQLAWVDSNEVDHDPHAEDTNRAAFV